MDDKNFADFFEDAVSELATRDELATSAIGKTSTELLFNYLASDFSGLLNEFGTDFSSIKINPGQFAKLIDFIADGKIMSRQAKDILRKMFETGESPEDIISKGGLETVSDEGSIKAVVLEVLKENEKAVSDHKKGSQGSIQFLIGKSMAKLRGAGNPEAIKKVLEKELTRQ